MYLEEDGDEIFTRIEDVHCCHLRFEDGYPVYSDIVKKRTQTGVWWCCSNCGASYGMASDN